MASMNEPCASRIPGHTDSSVPLPNENVLGSMENFPPLPSQNLDGSSSTCISGEPQPFNHGDGSSSRPLLPDKGKSKMGVIGNGNRLPYVNMFKDNRKAKSEYKLEFVEPGAGMLAFEEAHVDSIEKTYGFCLLGYVISGKPPTTSLTDLVRRWGPNIQFQTHDSGWIIFKFPSAKVRDRILVGGPYMVYGFRMFIKEMPQCFRFREEDMNTIPAWVQIHGLPPDCWNPYVLSQISSVIGKPVHMDMLTHERKRIKFARVLVELDLSKPKMDEVNILYHLGLFQIGLFMRMNLSYVNFARNQGMLRNLAMRPIGIWGMTKTENVLLRRGVDPLAWEKIKEGP